MPTRGQKSGSGTDHSIMRELNRTLVLDVVKKTAPISRASIARETSLAKPTVSAIVDDLIGEGLVREVGVAPTASGGGRPPILLEFNVHSQFIVGLQIGVGITTIVVADALGQEIDREQVKTPRAAADEALRQLAGTVKEILKRSGATRKRLTAVGVCVPGLVDMRSGTCLLAPNIGWRDVPVRKLLRSELRVPVFVVNTVDAAMVVESIDGAAAGVENAVLLWIGRGVGAAVLSEGRLFHGSLGLSGEIGHCHIPGSTVQCSCGKIGCLEAIADGHAIAQTAVAASRAGRTTALSQIPPERLTAEDVGVAAADGDEVAIEVLEEAGRLLGVAASWLINLFNPEVLLIGGGLAGVGDPLFRSLNDAAFEHALPQSASGVVVRPWAFGGESAVKGAVLVALQRSESYYRVMFQG